jgi:hypothetical protein
LLGEKSLQTNSLYVFSITVLTELLKSYIQYRKYVASKMYDSKKNKLKSFSNFLNMKKITLLGAFSLIIAGPVYSWWYNWLESYVKNIFALKIKHNFIKGDTSSDFMLDTFCKLAMDRALLAPSLLHLSLMYARAIRFSRATHDELLERPFVSSLLTNWKYLTISQAINFSSVPLEYRVVFGSICSSLLDLYSLIQ